MKGASKHIPATPHKPKTPKNEDFLDLEAILGGFRALFA